MMHLTLWKKKKKKKKKFYLLNDTFFLTFCPCRYALLVSKGLILYSFGVATAIMILIFEMFSKTQAINLAFALAFFSPGLGWLHYIHNNPSISKAVAFPAKEIVYSVGSSFIVITRPCC